MRVKKFIYSLLLILFASFFALQPTFALTEPQMYHFSNVNAMFYDPGDSDTLNCYSTSARTVTEDDVTSYIWNYFVRANIPNLSNNAEAIAGILGNFHQENSSFNPFSWGGTYYDENGNLREHARGIYKAHSTAFKEKVESVFGSDIWGKDLSNFTAEQIKSAVQVELDFLISADYDWNAKSMGDRWHYVKQLNVPTIKAGEEGAAAYAELFMLLFERPENWPASDSRSNKSYLFYIQDSGVASYERDLWGKNNKWSFGLEGGQPRRSYWARYYYNKYANNQIMPSAEEDITGSEVTVIGDGTISNSLTADVSGIDVKSANTIVEASELVKNDPVIRENIVLSLDLTKEIIGEENFSSFLSSISTKKLYVVLNTDYVDNDNYKVNEGLITSNLDSLQVIYINSSKTLAQAISEMFKKPVVTICTSSSSNSQYLDAVKPVMPLYTSSADIPCANSTEQVSTNSTNNVYENGYHGGSQIEGGINLCYLPTNIVTGSTYQTMDTYSGKTYQCGSHSYSVPNYNTDQYKALEIHPKSSTAIVNSRISGAFLTFATYMKEIIGKNEPLNVLSSFRSVEFQKLLYGVTPYGSNCSWNGYKNAGKPGNSGHNGGFAVDLDLKYLTNAYNTSSSFKQYIDNYIADNNLTSASCASIDVFNWNDRKDDENRWNDNIHKFLCGKLKDFGFYFTVYDEPWHIEAREK